MRTLQSSSRHSSKQRTAHNRSRPTASQLKGFSDTITNWFENHRPQGTQISTVANAPFRSKLESDHWVLSTGLIMWISHRKEIRKLTFLALALRRSGSYWLQVDRNARQHEIYSLRQIWLEHQWHTSTASRIIVFTAVWHTVWHTVWSNRQTATCNLLV